MIRVSGSVDFDMDCSFYLVCHNSTTSPRQQYYKSQFTHEKNEWLNGRGWGVGIITHAELFSNRQVYIPNGKIHVIVKVVTRSCPKCIDPSTNSVDVLTKLFETMMHSDLTITSSGGDELKAHKAILCAKSDVFSAMFSTEMRESLSGIVESSDLDTNILKELIRFIYCNKVEGIESVDVELYAAAKRYQIVDLETICLQSIYGRLSEVNAVDIALFADLYELNALLSCCALFIHV